MIGAYNGKKPNIDPSAFVADSAILIGDLEVGAEASIWFGSIVRADVNRIEIGEATNIQDCTVIHVTSQLWPVIIGAQVTVGHRAVLHGCTIGPRSLIGMGAIILDGADIGEYCIIGAGSLVTEGTKIPSRTLAFGSPARPVRELKDKELEDIILSARHYAEYAKIYKG